MHGVERPGPDRDEQTTLVRPPSAAAPTLAAEDLSADEADTLVRPGGDAAAGAAPPLRTIPRDGYAIEGHFAQGGIGRILRARDRHLGRPVALKELLVADRGEAERRFVREALLTARLQHPAIVPIYEAGRWPSGEPFYAMKLVSGRSLFDVIAERPTLDERLALLPSVLTVAEAVAYAHAHGVIHRDLKPENVLVGEYGETVVIDWGLAKDLRAGDDDAAPTAPTPAEPAPADPAPDRGLTLAGAVMGTPSYMPPEQAEGRPVDARADVYAIGAILYHLLTGEPPYDAETAMAILVKVLTEPPPPLIERAPGVPRDLAAIVDLAMARDPAARYPSARELADDLRRFLTGKLVAAHHYSRAERLRRWLRRNRAAALVASVAALVLALVGGASLRSVLESEAEARAAEAQARAAEARALQRADALALDQARQIAPFQPNRAIELLAGLTDRSEWRRLRVIAADAQTHGVSAVYRGHLRGTSRVVFSPDGARLVTTSDDCSARLWDLAGGDHRVLVGHRDQVWRAAFSPDGRRIATTSRDGDVRLWDAETGAPGPAITAPASTRALAFSRAGDRLVFSTDGRELWTWAPGAEEPRRLAGCEAAYLFTDGRTVGCMVDRQTIWIGGLDGAGGRTLAIPGATLGPAGAITPDGRVIALAGEDGVVSVVDLPSGRITRLSVSDQRVRAVAFSPDGALLAAGARGDVTPVWRVATGERVHSLRGADLIIRLEFSPDGALLAGVGSDPTIHLWSLADGAERPLVGFTQAALGVTFSPDAHRLAAVGIDGELRIWEMDQVLHRHLGAPGPARRVAAFAADGESVLVGEPDGAIRRWSVDGSSRPVPVAAHPRPLLALAERADVLVSLDEGGLLRAWDRAGRLLAERQLAGAWPQPVHLLAVDGDRAVIAHEGGVSLWTLGPEPERPLAPLTGLARALLSADGRYLATGTTDGEVLRWDLAGDGPPLHVHRFATAVSALHLSPDGQVIVSGADDNLIHVRDLRGGGAEWTLPGEGLIVRSVALDPAATRVAYASRNNVIRVASLASRAPGRPLLGHRGHLIELAFVDSDTLASRSMDGEVRLWDVESGEGRLVPALAPQGHLSVAPRTRALLTSGAGAELYLWRDDLPRDPARFAAWLDAAWRPIEGPPLPEGAAAACPALTEAAAP